jgi:hypothetical protein
MPDRTATPYDHVAGWLALLILSIPLGHASAGATTGGRITGEVLINSQPAAGAVVFLQPASGLFMPGLQETEPATEALLRNEIATFTAELRRDVEQLQ